jgi:hypothetical protein
MKKLLFCLFLISCTSPNSNLKINRENIVFNDDLSFNEINELLIRYSESTPYPNIDE